MGLSSRNRWSKAAGSSQSVVEGPPGGSRDPFRDLVRSKLFHNSAEMLLAIFALCLSQGPVEFSKGYVMCDMATD